MAFFHVGDPMKKNCHEAMDGLVAPFKMLLGSQEVMVKRPIHGDCVRKCWR